MSNPIQPLEKDKHGVLRFKENAIVADLFEFAATRGMGMNEIARGNFTAGDRQQFAQLLGYRLSDYGELSYVDDLAYSMAVASIPGDI